MNCDKCKIVKQLTKLNKDLTKKIYKVNKIIRKEDKRTGGHIDLVTLFEDITEILGTWKGVEE